MSSPPNGERRPLAGTALETPTTRTETSVPTQAAARVMTLYRITGTRVTSGERETCTAIRRQLPAAVRLAEKWRDLGRRPVRIDTVTIPADGWVSLG